MCSQKPITVYLRWPERDLLSLSPLVRLLWGSLIDDLITIYDRRAGKGCRPTLLLIDEAGRTAIPSLSDHSTTVVGRQISLWIAVQSLSPSRDRLWPLTGQYAPRQHGHSNLLSPPAATAPPTTWNVPSVKNQPMPTPKQSGRLVRGLPASQNRPFPL
jgi:hypothetical protein